jgi:hypothetical protein
MIEDIGFLGIIIRDNLVKIASRKTVIIRLKVQHRETFLFNLQKILFTTVKAD